MIRVAVLVPVLNRPERAAPLVESLAASVVGPLLGAVPVFIASPGDDAEIEAATAASGRSPLVVNWPPGPGDYARKINYGWRIVEALSEDMFGDIDFMLLGADDLRFHPGWLEAALVAQLHTGACVVGTNDLGNATVMRGNHSTHPLVHVGYETDGTIDEPFKILHEGYDHSFCDTELVATAKARGTWTFAPDAHVEHLHPFWGKSPMDATYRKGQKETSGDRALFRERSKLWGTGEEA